MKNNVESILNRLCDDGIEFDQDEVLNKVEEYLGLIREWNAYASLVSVQDAKTALESHLVDSWTLVPLIRQYQASGVKHYLDLGSGGGFPAIPICIVLGDLQTVLVDRSVKKTVFLKKAVRRLALGHVSVENRSFEGDPGSGNRLITSRAIEKPLEVIPSILGGMAVGDVYLCQSPALEELQLESRFEMERISDHYSRDGFRRSTLYVVRCTSK